MEETRKPVLITTEFRGVFFGYLADGSKLPRSVTLRNACNVIKWTSDCGGFMGLASDGPTEQCKIGKRVPEITLWKVTSMTPVTENAENTWKSFG